MEKVFQAHGPKKQVGIAILVSDKNRPQTNTNGKRIGKDTHTHQREDPPRGHCSS